MHMDVCERKKERQPAQPLAPARPTVAEQGCCVAVLRMHWLLAGFVNDTPTVQ